MKIPISDYAVFFLHIPKCAGSSFGVYFDKQLRPSGEFFWHGHDGDLNCLANDEIFYSCGTDKGIRFFGGHFTISTAKKIIRDVGLKNYLICSIVRNPIDQAISYYNWVRYLSAKRGAPHPLYEYSKQMSVSEFFSDSSILSEVSNIQSRYLLGGVFDDNSCLGVIDSFISELRGSRNLIIKDVSKISNLVSTVSSSLFKSSRPDLEQSLNLSRTNVSGDIRAPLSFSELSLINNVFKVDLIFHKALTDNCA